MELEVLPPLGMPQEEPKQEEKEEKGKKKKASFRAPEQFKPNQLAIDSKQ